MDSFNFYDIKAEKANAILRYNQLRKIANLFRFVEVLVILILVSRLSLHIPHAVKNSGGYVRGLTLALFSPRFVFVLGNVIVITLFVKSGQFSSRDSAKRFTEHDLYDEFVKSSGEKSQRAFRDKKPSIPETRVVVAERIKNETVEIRRSNSAIIERPKKAKSVLKRSETEKFEKKNEKSGEKSDECLFYPEDLMSGDEFRLKVEAFIARQQRFRMEEEYFGEDIE